MSKLGSHGLGWVSEGKAKQPDSQTSKRSGGKPKVPKAKAGGKAVLTGAKYKDWKKVTYYLDPQLVTRLRVHSASTDEDQSDIVNEAVKQYLADRGA